MKTLALSITLLVVMTAVAQAQVTFEYSRRNRNSSLTVTYSSGVGYGYGYGGYGGYSYGGFGYGSGLYYGGYGGPLIYSYGGYGDPYNGGYYGGYRYRGAYGRPAAATEAAGPAPHSGPVADRIPEFTAAREIEEGRRRLKAGDYRGAVDDFRSAVAAHTDSPLAQAWFAVALAIAGDGKNADKALRAAAAGGIPSERLSLADGFREEKERVRVIVALARVTGEGSLAAAYALDRLGEPARLKQLAEKDPVARQLLPK
ncbi:MAG TPA: hypothetical protein VNM14_20440 [Planctomycetota bacterium]|nr:hypothetical protein [Planctomycetota bacterium]